MKKAFAILIVLAMVVVGCATPSGGPSPVNNFFCNPTDAQRNAAKVGMVVVQVAIGAGAAFLGQGQLASLIDAQKIYDRVVQGYCVTQTQWDTATAAVVEAQTVTANKDLKMRAQNTNIQLLQNTKW